MVSEPRKKQGPRISNPKKRVITTEINTREDEENLVRGRQQKEPKAANLRNALKLGKKHKTRKRILVTAVMGTAVAQTTRVIPMLVPA